jgi:hypothetical protein
VRKVVLGIVMALAGAGCAGAGSISSSGLTVATAGLQVESSPGPFSQIAVGQVQALVPEGWRAFSSSTSDDLRNGFVATPEPRAWQRMDGSAIGMAATWVDATRVGIPSDFYYLAATGPILSSLTNSGTCRPRVRRVFVDDRPTFESGPPGSAGDFVASGNGTCSVAGELTHWAYFVAAPGFGPVRRIGIPSSGLYVVVIVMPDSRRVVPTLHRLLASTQFGGARIRDFVAAARAA